MDQNLDFVHYWYFKMRQNLSVCTGLTFINTMFLAMASAVLVVRFTSLDKLLHYGKTYDPSKSKLPSQWYNRIFQWYVPKHWFWHFYLLSSVLSAVSLICFYHVTPYWTSGTIINTLMLVHGLRRLFECHFFHKPDSSRIQIPLMHITHYLVGIAFYSLVAMFVVLQHATVPLPVSTQNLYFTGFIFTAASISQSLHHWHLANLKKYTLPTYGLFRYVACAHYFFEILIYFSFWFIIPATVSTFQAQESCWPGFKGTLLSLLVWIVVNLSASAEQTFIYYQTKFNVNKNNCTRYYKIIPLIF